MGEHPVAKIVVFSCASAIVGLLAGVQSGIWAERQSEDDRLEKQAAKEYVQELCDLVAKNALPKPPSSNAQGAE